VEVAHQEAPQALGDLDPLGDGGRVAAAFDQVALVRLPEQIEHRLHPAVVLDVHHGILGPLDQQHRNADHRSAVDR